MALVIAAVAFDDSVSPMPQASGGAAMQDEREEALVDWSGSVHFGLDGRMQDLRTADGQAGWRDFRLARRAEYPTGRRIEWQPWWRRRGDEARRRSARQDGMPKKTFYSHKIDGIYGYRVQSLDSRRERFGRQGPDRAPAAARLLSVDLRHITNLPCGGAPPWIASPANSSPCPALTWRRQRPSSCLRSAVLRRASTSPTSSPSWRCVVNAVDEGSCTGSRAVFPAGI